MAGKIICNFNKYSHCKYGKFCNFRHVYDKCEEVNCDVKNCILRHPKDCRYIMNGGSCKFKEFCAFEHGNEETREKDRLAFQSLQVKVKELEKIVMAKDVEITRLKNCQSPLENMLPDENVKEDTSGPNDEKASGATGDTFIEKKIQHQCDLCAFTSEKKIGVTIHRTKKHKYNCVGCGNDFNKEADIKNHECEEIEDLHNPNYDNFYVAKRKKNKCFNIITRKYNKKKTIATLHSNDCYTTPSLSCSTILANSCGKKDIDVDQMGVLHMMANKVIIEDTVDWEELYRYFVGYSLMD